MIQRTDALALLAMLLLQFYAFVNLRHLLSVNKSSVYSPLDDECNEDVRREFLQMQNKKLETLES